jgi:hypothetical protein
VRKRDLITQVCADCPGLCNNDEAVAMPAYKTIKRHNADQKPLRYIEVRFRQRRTCRVSSQF